MRKMIYSVAMLLTGVFAADVSAVSYNDAERCHLDGGKGQLVQFGGTQVTSNGTKGYNVSTNVPAGKYDVYLEAFDGYEGRANAHSESDERFAVAFRSGGGEVATSSSSKDIDDGVENAYWSGKVNSNLDLSKDVDQLHVMHARPGNSDHTNSLTPTCMLLVKQEEKKPVKEQPRVERTIVDPVCGNSIVEPGEQCDDGNANEISCTRQCTLATPAPTPAPRPAPTPDRNDKDDDDHSCDGEVGNTVFNDLNANGVHDKDEPGLTDVKVKLQYGDKVKTDRTNFRGRYKFEGRCEDTYRVIVAVETLPSDTCYQTYDKDGKLDHTHKLELDDNDDEYRKADFGYHCPLAKTVARKVSPATGAGPLAGGAAAAFATGAAWIANRRMNRDGSTIIPMT